VIRLQQSSSERAISYLSFHAQLHIFETRVKHPFCLGGSKNLPEAMHYSCVSIVAVPALVNTSVSRWCTAGELEIMFRVLPPLQLTIRDV